MRRAALLAGLLLGALAAGCGGGLTSGPDTPPPAPLQLLVNGTSCEGEVFYTVGSDTNEPDGQPADFPWTGGFQANSGDVVTLRACNTCVQGGCPSLPCDETIRTTIFWKGNVLATSSATGKPDPSCLPATQVTATIP